MIEIDNDPVVPQEHIEVSLKFGVDPASGPAEGKTHRGLLQEATPPKRETGSGFTCGAA